MDDILHHGTSIGFLMRTLIYRPPAPNPDSKTGSAGTSENTIPGSPKRLQLSNLKVAKLLSRTGPASNNREATEREGLREQLRTADEELDNLRDSMMSFELQVNLFARHFDRPICVRCGASMFVLLFVPHSSIFHRTGRRFEHTPMPQRSHWAAQE